jgi:hypothetical protein
MKWKKGKHKSHCLISFSRVFPNLARPNLNTFAIKDYTNRVPSGSYAIYESYCPSFRCKCHEVKVDIYLLVETGHKFIASLLFQYDERIGKDNPRLDLTEEQSQFATEIIQWLKAGIEQFSFLASRRNMFVRRSHLMKEVGYNKKHPAHDLLQELWRNALQNTGHR